MLQPLHVEGDRILRADGSRFKAIGCSDFGQPKRWRDTPGHPEILVEPILVERTKGARDAGWTGDLVARMFRHAAPSNPFGMDPWSYAMAEMAALTRFYNDHGWYVDWTAGDYQICFPGPTPLDGPRGVHEHHNQFTAALIGTQYLWNICNEPFKNGLDPFQALPPPWVTQVWYSGSYDDPRDPRCVNLHTDRNDEGGIPKWVGKAHESAPYMWKHGKPVIYDEPMGAADTTIPGRRSNNPHYFGILGTVLALVDLVYFHSDAGLSSDGFTPIQAACWSAFCKGAAGAVLL